MRPFSICLVACLTACSEPSDPTQANVEEGPLHGAVADSTRVFLGIPYAEPPVAALRWRAPKSHSKWTATRDALTRGAKCPQLDLVSGQVVGDEDCLTLNVWAPKSAEHAPVMLYVHGGSYTLSSGGDPEYDGKRLSETAGVVVVTINYRLGPLGFFAHDALSAEDSAHPTSGNYGLEDQRAALAWVQKNIGAFGGDPNRVTLFGLSAGGESVCLHMVSTKSQGLFQRAIIQSGSCGAAPLARNQDTSSSMATTLGCDQADPLACLRQKSVADLMAAVPTGAGWGPVVDGWNLSDDPQKLLDAGQLANKVPLIIGTSRDEADFMFGLGLLPPVTDEASYTSLVDNVFGSTAAGVLAQYPVSSYSSAGKAASAVFTDAFFLCPARRVARAMVATGAGVYTYSFAHAPTSPVFPGAGAFHTADEAFVFGNSAWGIVLDEQEQQLSRTMMGYWGRMAKSGDPNGSGALAWPKRNEGDTSIVFDLSLSTKERVGADACAFWDAL